MSGPTLTDLLQANVNMGVEVALPFLGALLVVGIVIGLLQAATQVNEPSISFLAKLLTLIALLALLGPWALIKTKMSLQQNMKAINAYARPEPVPISSSKSNPAK